MGIHPLYDVAAAEWVAEFNGNEICAASLRDLKAKLPPDTHIEGYSPDGYQAQREGSITVSRRVPFVATSLSGMRWRARPEERKEERKERRSRRPFTVQRNCKLWTEEEDARLRELSAQGLTGNDIANTLGRTRCSVMGRCARLEIRLRSEKLKCGGR